MSRKLKAGLLIALLAANALLSPVLSCTAYADTDLTADNTGIVHINSVKDFLLFTSLCSSDEFSEGKQFSLEADLDFTGLEFKPVPIFAGSFEGNNHTLKGILKQGQGQSMGVFRYAEAGAVIKNLNIEAQFLLSDSSKKVGGIVGTNKGQLESCTFKGNVSSLEESGGIAGINEEGAVIKNCINYGIINGNKRIGGICGFNYGEITASINKGEVNTSAKDIEDKDEKIDPEKLKEALDIEKIQDSGGIAGYSGGHITSCINEGNVGYKHKGYNVGGITGRQDGIISDCINYGIITGRKDTGGITGQFEPYLNIVYNRDTFDNVEDELNEISRLSRSLSGNIENTVDNSSQHMSNAKSIIDNIKAAERSSKTDLKADRDSFKSEAEAELDEIDALAAAIDSDLETSSTREKFYPVRNDINDLKANIDRLKYGDWDNQNENLISRIISLRRLVNKIKQNADALSDDANSFLNDGIDDTLHNADKLKEDVKQLYDKLKAVGESAENYSDKLSTVLDNADKDISQEVDKLSSELDSFSDNVRVGKENARTDKRGIENSLDNIQDHINEGKENLRLKSQSDDKDKLPLFNEVSEDSLSYEGKGLIKNCENNGDIVSDYQAGGITGNIGIDIASDPEYDIDTKGNESLNITRNAHTVLRLCKNLGAVKTKNDYVGGIAGKSSLGTITLSQNYGDVTAADGSYAGGIAGSSSNTISSSWSMGDISAKSYLGGIAGYGNVLKDNHAMPFIKNTNSEFTGSIAGAVKDQADISGNIYVDSQIGAIDGVTRKVQAKGMDYHSFIAGENVPDNFKHLTVTFETEDGKLKTVQLNYGESIDKSVYPEVPPKEGYYYVWEEKDLSNITENEKVKAFYLPWKTTIASSDEEKPLLLAEGNFLPEARLVIEDSIVKRRLKAPAGLKIAGIYKLNIENASNEANYTYHLFVKEADNSKIGIVNTDSAKGKASISLIEAEIDGNYIVFQATAQVEIVVFKKDYTKPTAVIVLIILLAAVGFAYTIILKKKK